MTVLATNINSLRMLALAAVIQGASSHCRGPYEYVLQDFVLTTCPDSGFSLAQSAGNGTDSVSAFRSFSVGATCPVLTLYELRENNNVRLNPMVKLKRSGRCTVQIAYSYDRAAAGPEEMTRMAETVARLVMHNSTSKPESTPVKTQRFRSRRELQDRCSISSAAQRNLGGDFTVASLNTKAPRPASVGCTGLADSLAVGEPGTSASWS